MSALKAMAPVGTALLVAGLLSAACAGSASSESDPAVSPRDDPESATASTPSDQSESELTPAPSPLWLYSLRDEFAAEGRLDDFEAMMEQGGPMVEGTKECNFGCTVTGRLTIDADTPCVVIEDEDSKVRIALAWEEGSVDWIGRDHAAILVRTAFPENLQIQHGSRVTIEGTPLDPASPFLTPKPTDLCASELWLVNFVLIGATPPTDVAAPPPTPTPG